MLCIALSRQLFIMMISLFLISVMSLSFSMLSNITGINLFGSPAYDWYWSFVFTLILAAISCCLSLIMIFIGISIEERSDSAK